MEVVMDVTQIAVAAAQLLAPYLLKLAGSVDKKINKMALSRNSTG